MTISRAVPILALLLAACAAGRAAVRRGGEPFDGVYAGTYELTGGSGRATRRRSRRR